MIVWQTKLAGFDIKLERTRASGLNARKYTVIYGTQAKAGLSYDQAALELGYSVMHALSCEGKLDN